MFALVESLFDRPLDTVICPKGLHFVDAECEKGDTVTAPSRQYQVTVVTAGKASRLTTSSI
jgi:hypothetical protein